MENRKNKKMSGIKPNRTATNGRFVKHISRLLVLVMLLTSALAFSGCEDISFELDNSLPDLSQGPIYYLCLGDINQYDCIDKIEYGYYEFEGSYSIENGETNYTTPILNVHYGFDSENIKKHSFLFLLTKSVGANVWGVFYPFKESLVDLKYEFKHIYSTHHIFNRVVYIYNASSLIGKLYYHTQSAVNQTWVEGFLNENLVLMSIYNYSEAPIAVESTRKVEILNKDEHITSYLTIGNLNDSKLCESVIEFDSTIDGGINIEFGTYKREKIINCLNLTIKADESMGFAGVSIDAKFYGVEKSIGVIRYEYKESVESTVLNVYSGDDLLGEIFISSDTVIPHEWIENFIDDCLVVVEFGR